MINVAVSGRKDVITFESDDGRTFIPFNVPIADYLKVPIGNRRGTFAHEVDKLKEMFEKDDSFIFKRHSKLSFSDLREALVKHFFPLSGEYVDMVVDEIMVRVGIVTVVDGYYDEENLIGELVAAKAGNDLKIFMDVYKSANADPEKKDTNYFDQVYILANLIKKEAEDIIVDANKKAQDIQKIPSAYYDSRVRDFEKLHVKERVLVAISESSAGFMEE